MKNQILFSLGLCGMMLVMFMPFGFAKATDAIYRTGKEAYERGDYLTASKNLFAYRNIAGHQIEKGLYDTITDAIAFCDEKIALAIRTKEELDKHGQITELVIESGGKADDWSTKERKVRYQKPTGRHLRKPPLPRSAPKEEARNPATAPSVPVARINKPVAFSARPDTPTARVKTLEEEIAELKKENSLMEAKYERRTEAYKALKVRYGDLLDAYKTLLDK